MSRTCQAVFYGGSRLCRTRRSPLSPFPTITEQRVRWKSSFQYHTSTPAIVRWKPLANGSSRGLPKITNRSSSSWMDRIQQQTKKTLESSKAAAAETAKAVVSKASSKVKDTAKIATETAQEAALKTLQKTQNKALQAKDAAVQTMSEKAAMAKREGSRKLSEKVSGVAEVTTKVLSTTKETVSQSATGVTQSTKEKISQSTKAMEETKQAATTKVVESSQQLKETTQQLKESMVSNGTKALRWFWWWSLAAIFVYGVASTLPMAIIKYTMEEKKKKWESSQSKETEMETTTKEPTIDANS